VVQGLRHSLDSRSRHKLPLALDPAQNENSRV